MTFAGEVVPICNHPSYRPHWQTPGLKRPRIGIQVTPDGREILPEDQPHDLGANVIEVSFPPSKPADPHGNPNPSLGAMLVVPVGTDTFRCVACGFQWEKPSHPTEPFDVLEVPACPRGCE
jgi:hypothetical protein